MNSDRRGSMPFAVVAVTILMMSVICGAVMASYERASDNAEDIERESDAVEASMEGIAMHVDRGLGEIILSISNDADLGGLDERAVVFKDRMEDWLSFQFPVADSGVRADMVSHDIELIAENMRDPASSEVEGGYVPAYLRATGTLTVDMRTDSGRARVDIDISTDGSYALPLVAGQGSMFETMTDSGGGISLSEMVTYQLTCLAQTRVLNGYGALSAYGEMGTSSVITKEDVERAYGNALSAIGLICFRTETGDLGMSTGTDLADLIVSDDGYLTIDIPLVYAQAVMGVIDEVALGWFEYLCADRVWDKTDYDQKGFLFLCDVIGSFLKGEDVLGAASYIREVMSSRGYSEDDYRYPGSGTTRGTFGDITVRVGNPTEDLFEQSWIKRFKSTYYQGADSMMDHLRSILNLAASRMADRMGMDAVKVKVDPNDDVAFSDTLSKALTDGLRRCSEGFEDAVRGSLESTSSFGDPFYGAIADAIDEHASDFVDSSAFMSGLERALTEAMPEGTDIQELLSSDTAKSMLRSYRNAVYSDLELFEELRYVPGGDPGIIDSILASLCSIGLDTIGVMEPVKASFERMGHEISERIRVNSADGITDLPGNHGFRLQDENGNTTTERITATVTSDPTVSRPLVDDDRCVHTVGFGEDRLASYTTVFRVTVDDSVSYRLIGSGTLSDSMGTTSSMLDGSSEPHLELLISVQSAWALAGVDYRPSSTVVSDAMEKVLELLGPIMEPLMEMMSLARDALVMLGEKLSEIANQVAEAIASMYDRFMEPIERINSWILDGMREIASQAGLDILLSVGLSDQFVSVGMGDYTLVISTNAVSWNATTKTLFSATLSGPVAGLMVSAGITVKCKGEVNAENLVITGQGSITGDDWSVKANVDPLMKGGKHLLTLDGEVDDTDISVTIPELVDYHELGVRLSDLPGIGQMLSSIPLPALGATAGIDAGFTLRYSAPIQTGLIINEFESNPPGDDTGNEWVEILNNSTQTIDLKGYTLVASSDWRNKTMELSGSISPGERLVIVPTFTLVNESGKYTKNGEAVAIKDPDGNTVDKTPVKKDSANDGDTWQRRFDGSTEWVFGKGTRGDSNSSNPIESLIPATDVKDLVWGCVEKAFGDVERITDTETLELFMKSLIKHVIDAIIKKVTARIVDASVFVKVDIGDAAGVTSNGIRVALVADDDLASDVLKYAAGNLQAMVLGVKNPYRIDPLGMFTENIDLEVMYHTSVGFPKLLAGENDELPKMDLAISFRANMASITRILGTDTGKPSVTCAIGALDCPYEVIPSKLNPNRNMDHDLWLMKVTVTWA